MKITKAWPAEEEEDEAVRKGLRGCSIRPLKRAEGRRRRMGNPSLTQKPRREGLGEGLARNLRRDAVDTGDPERGRLGRRLSSVLSIPEGSCLFFEKPNTGFCCEKPRGGDGTGTVMGTESTYQVTCGDHGGILPSFYPHLDNTIIDLTKS